MTYVLNKSLEKNKRLELYLPGGVCHMYKKGFSTAVVMVP